jgi:hypothetical protein
MISEVSGCAIPNTLTMILKQLVKYPSNIYTYQTYYIKDYNINKNKKRYSRLTSPPTPTAFKIFENKENTKNTN